MSRALPRADDLRWVFEATHRTRGHNTVLDLRKCRLRVLARELGEGWYGLATEMGYAPTTIRRISVVVRAFLDFAAEAGLPHRLSVADEDAALVDCIHEWELSLVRKYAASSNLPYKDSQQLATVFRWLMQCDLGTGTLVRAWADAPPLAPPKRESPVDEVPNKPRLELQDACRRIVREAEARIRKGRELAAAGRNGPDEPLSLSGLLSALLNWDEFGMPALGMTPGPDSAPQELLDEMGWTSESHPSRFRLAMRSYLVHLLSPSPRELQAFRILLLMQTGWAPEQLTDLRLKGIVFGDGTVTVTTQKHRARAVKPYEYSKGSSNWNVWSLLHRVMALTEHLRHLGTAPREEQYLFARMIRSGHGRPIFTNEVFKRYLLKDLVLEEGISWSGPYDIRRLRKTFKTIQGAITGTAAGAAGMDHTVRVSRDHYMQTTTVHVLAAQAVNAAQKFVHERVIVGPTVVTARAAEIQETHNGPEIRDKAMETARESPKDMEMGVTACRDPYDSPFTPTGRLCHLRPSSCFLCPNALVFQDHLPRILAFRDTVLAQQPNFVPSEFEAVWGAALASIDAIIAEFSAGQVEEASSGLPFPIHVPISQRIQFS